ncbi:hypothetical protein HDU67_001547 [Dinochytrium kinnereticum]|nr:hypothetical protein HDU67_001547 [Dinochytrium kinnereticum]
MIKTINNTVESRLAGVDVNMKMSSDRDGHAEWWKDVNTCLLNPLNLIKDTFKKEARKRYASTGPIPFEQSYLNLLVMSYPRKTLSTSDGTGGGTGRTPGSSMWDFSGSNTSLQSPSQNSNARSPSMDKRGMRSYLPQTVFSFDTPPTPPSKDDEIRHQTVAEPQPELNVGAPRSLVFSRTPITVTRAREFADIVFLMDVTGSMQKHIDNARETLKEIMKRVKDEITTFEPRVAFVGYRDYKDEQRFVVMDFTIDLGKAVDFIGGVLAKGGGDYPEDVKGGLCEALKLSWSSRYKILLHIADAPAHGIEFHGGRHRDDYPDGGPAERTMDEIFQMITERRIIYNFMRLNDTCDLMIEAFNTIVKRYNRGKPIRVSDLNSEDVSSFLNLMVRSISSSMRAL